MIQTKRVYEPAARLDGQRFLVERLWPRGVRKETLFLTGWCREAAPSHALRKWFNHDPTKWPEFQKRYCAELNGKPDAWRPMLEAAVSDDLTLLFSARDTEHNNAIALKAYLEKHLKTDASEFENKEGRSHKSVRSTRRLRRRVKALHAFVENLIQVKEIAFALPQSVTMMAQSI